MTTLEKEISKSNNNKEFSNLILFSFGKFFSLFGTSVYTFALGLYVLKLTGSGLSFATTLVLGMLPLVIVNPFAGVLADRLDRKFLVVIMDLLNGILLIGLYFLSSVNGLSLMMIYISTFIMAVFTTIFNVSIEAAKPNLVTEDKFMSINSISKIIESLSSILGPMIGGLIFALIDMKYFIIFNGISFILSGISEMFIEFNVNNKELEKSESKINFIEDIKEGFKYMLGKQQIVSLFAVFVSINFFISLSISVPLPFIINNVLELSSKNYGIIQGAFPLGMIMGAIFVKKVFEKLSYNKLLLLMIFVMSICMVMIGIPVLPIQVTFGDLTLLMYYSFIMGTLGIVIALIDIPIIFILQKIIPDYLRGRVLSIGQSLGKIVSPIALLISGVLMNVLPSYLLPFIGGVILLLFGIVFSKLKHLY